MVLDTLPGLHNQYRIDAEQVQMQRGENLILSVGTLILGGCVIIQQGFVDFGDRAKDSNSKLNIGS
jgi:hypothetical protein